MASAKFDFSETPDSLNLTALPIQEPPPGCGTLLPWILYYIGKDILGRRSSHTIDAKLRDLQKFVNYFHRFRPYGGIESWDKVVTSGFVGELERIFKPASVRRIVASLSHFATWMERRRVIEHEDNPVRGIGLPSETPKQPKHIVCYGPDGQVFKESADAYALLVKAADKLIGEHEKDPEHRDRRFSLWPYRDKALLLTLYHTGLRVSEVCTLKFSTTGMRRLSDPEGIEFLNVKCKGNRYRDVFARDHAAHAIDAYIEHERGTSKTPDNLFLMDGQRRSSDKYSRTENRVAVTRAVVWRALMKIATRAAQDLGPGYRFELHPHRLRHEHGYNLKKGGFSDSEIRDQLGHRTMQYVGLYSQSPIKERYKRLSEI